MPFPERNDIKSYNDRSAIIIRDVILTVSWNLDGVERGWYLYLPFNELELCSERLSLMLFELPFLEMGRLSPLSMAFFFIFDLKLKNMPIFLC